VIGGLSREFYHRVWLHYNDSVAWKWEKHSEFGNKGQGTVAMDGENRTMWIFEPHVAEAVFEELVKENNIRVLRNEWLDREKGVEKVGGAITSIKTLSGKRISGKMFIDATYEGDLMAAAGVYYVVGREANSVYNETYNGVQADIKERGHFFKDPIDPYRIPGRKESGLLDGISAEPISPNEGDVQVHLKYPYSISYGSIVPKRSECTNLLVPVCVSASHIAFGSIRMEPVFMILGQSAVVAACLAMESHQGVQDISYDALKTRLLERGQVLQSPLKEQK
jgi:hypothetical protein